MWSLNYTAARQAGLEDPAGELDHSLARQQLLPAIFPNHCQSSSTAPQTEEKPQALLPTHQPCGPVWQPGVIL